MLSTRNSPALTRRAHSGSVRVVMHLSGGGGFEPPQPAATDRRSDPKARVARFVMRPATATVMPPANVSRSAAVTSKSWLARPHQPTALSRLEPLHVIE